MRSLLMLVLLSVATAQAYGAPVTSAPNSQHGKELAARLCSNCHLVGTSEQQQANAANPAIRIYHDEWLGQQPEFNVFFNSQDTVERVRDCRKYTGQIFSAALSTNGSMGH